MLTIFTSNCYGQTVSGWDAAVTSGYGSNNYQLIGTYQGWDPAGIYIADYNFYNNPSYATKRIYMGSMFQDLGSGNIGIGTSDTQGYKLAINGSVIATSIKVKLYTNWPDFVFNKNYQLSSLNDVKNYIDKNNRLPDMPSAEQVHINGLDLGEMNRLLLKKVEELTLYLIEQNKRISQLEIKMNTE